MRTHASVQPYASYIIYCKRDCHTPQVKRVSSSGQMHLKLILEETVFFNFLVLPISLRQKISPPAFPAVHIVICPTVCPHARQFTYQLAHTLVPV